MAQSEMRAFWLLPEAASKSELDEIIRDLAGRLDAPAFEPHLTIGGGDVDDGQAVHVLNRLRSRPPITLQVAGIEFSEKYTKTLFVQFAASAEVQALSGEIAQALGKPYELNPHVSLLYKELPEAQKAQLAGTIKLPFDEVTFDRSKVISTPHPITSRKQVEAWRTVALRPLSSP